MIEAGCKEKTYNTYDKGKFTYNTYHWIASGTLVAKGVCVGRDYLKYFVPEKGITKVYTTIEDQKVRAVDAREGTVSVDFTLRMRWSDPHIKTNFSSRNKENRGIALSPSDITAIWTPDTDLYILNRRSFKFEEEWASVKSCTILATEEFSQVDAAKNTGNQTSTTTVEMRYEIKSTVYCHFDHSRYPMDTQMCNVSFGSGSSEAIFELYGAKNTSHSVAANFDMSITFFDEQLNEGSNTIGMHIKMSRKLKPFILKYYIPCIAIALVSELSFVIPVTAIPGRVGCLVTLFLTLTNLFIHQMVRRNTQITFI